MNRYYNPRDIEGIAVHTTGTRQSALVSSIMGYWSHEKGWNNPGYHYMVDQYGDIHQILDESGIANGVRGYNSKLIHVAWIGGLDDDKNHIDNRTPIQKQALLELIRTLMRKYKVSAKGHRDFSPDANGDGEISPDEWMKDCPLFDVASEIDALWKEKKQ